MAEIEIYSAVLCLFAHRLRLTLSEKYDYINTHLKREVSLTELAAIAQLSQYHFCRAFKESTELSPHQYLIQHLIQQRVERAK
jgi:AraC family transcriptional regulator